jgi:hypothetical protein
MQTVIIFTLGIATGVLLRPLLDALMINLILIGEKIHGTTK